MKSLKFMLTALGLLCLSATALAQSLPSYVPTNGLVGWWPFTGSAVDSSGNGNNGTVNGATLTTDRMGNPNSAYYYSSSGCDTRIDYNLNTTSIVSGLTISIWVMKSDEGCVSPRFFEFWSGANGPGNSTGWWGTPNPTNFVGIDHTTGNGTGCWYNFPAPANNVWTNLVYTNDGIKARYYQDGVFVGEVNSSGAIVLASSLALGRMNHPAYDAFNGKIDDFGLWNRALTQQEITNLYTASTSAPTACLILPANLQNGLVGYWPFCGNANDESGNNRHGTLLQFDGQSYIVNPNIESCLSTDRFGNTRSTLLTSKYASNVSIPVNNSIFQSDFTISIWAKNDSIRSEYPTIFESENNFLIQYGNTGGPITISSYLETLTSPPFGGVISQIDQSNWSHIMIVNKNYKSSH